MIDPRRFRPSWLQSGIAAAVLVVCMPGAVLGQNEAEEAEEAEEAVEVVNQANMIHLSPEQAAHWVFGNQILIQGGAVQSYRGTISDGLKLELDLIETVAPLADPQRKKLELAGLGDIDRFMDAFEAFARECPGGAVTQTRYIELNQKAQPLARRYRAGLHKQGSLFRKVLRSTLDGDQLERVDALQAERDRKRYQALVKATVAMIDQKIPLTADQRTRLIDVTMSETEPLHVTIESHYKYFAVLFQMSEIPQQQIKPIFQDNEWPAVQAVLRQGQMARGMIIRAQDADFDE